MYISYQSPSSLFPPRRCTSRAPRSDRRDGKERKGQKQKQKKQQQKEKRKKKRKTKRNVAESSTRLSRRDVHRISGARATREARTHRRARESPLYNYVRLSLTSTPPYVLYVRVFGVLAHVNGSLLCARPVAVPGAHDYPRIVAFSRANGCEIERFPRELLSLSSRPCLSPHP